jgi:hypothetical protein
MTRHFGTRAALAALVFAACGGKKPTPTPTPRPPIADTMPSRPEPPASPDMPPEPAKPEAPPAPASTHAPEFFAPNWTQVGVGQTISFSVAVIDQDLDETAVTVTKMPASARFDPITQTITWTPTKADMPKATFTVGATTGPITWKGNDVAGTNATTKTFEIAVTKQKQPAPVAAVQGLNVEALFTIRQPDRLAQVNKDWPFDAMLARTEELFRSTFAPEVAAKLGKVDKAIAFHEFLKGLADTHQNPRLDPDSPAFDKAAFGDPKSWKIVTVRPRLDKKFEEVRIVYQATKAHEPVFAMFRIRPVIDVPTLPPEARLLNNKALLQIVWNRLFTKAGALDPRWAKDQKAHGKAVAALVKDVMTFEDKSQPWAKTGFVALPTEARMGGGSARNPDGSYKSGDGWAWGVEKPMLGADGTQHWVDIGIPGFWTQAVPSPDGKTWAPKCAPRFDAADPAHAAGYEILCRKALGFVDQPDTSSGKVAVAKIDATNLFVEHKNVHSVAKLALTDGRRDLGEENGMTCAQCHIRNFGVRSYKDLATVDPSAGTPAAPNHPIDTLNFQIIPTETWQAYTLEFMQDQECKASVAFVQQLGQTSSLVCPLAAN